MDTKNIQIQPNSTLTYLLLTAQSMPTFIILIYKVLYDNHTDFASNKLPSWATYCSLWATYCPERMEKNQKKMHA